MASKRQHRIERAFVKAEAEFGEDKSTEFLIQVTAERMRITYANVVAALAAVHAA